MGEVITLPAHYALTHLDLPCEDGTFVENSQEHPQGMLLTGAIWPVIRRLYPDGRYFIGQDCGIYWSKDELPGYQATSPDWYFVPDVPADLDGEPRRSYVIWRESELPLVALEYVSGDGSEERDRTPGRGKFWIYERKIRPAYYGIYERDPGRIELYHLEDSRYRPVAPNSHGQLPIAPFGLALGIWNGTFGNMTVPWMRWYDLEGNILPSDEERAEQERQRAEQARQRADQERQRADQERQRADTLAAEVERLQARLRSHGLPPNGPEPPA